MSEKHEKELIRELIKNNSKIEGVKVIRKILSCSIKEAKELYERFEAEPSCLDNYSFYKKEVFPLNEIIELSLSDIAIKVIEMVKKGEIIQAIKYIKEQLSIGLKEAKDIIDRYKSGEEVSLEKYQQKQANLKPNDEIEPGEAGKDL